MSETPPNMPRDLYLNDNLAAWVVPVEVRFPGDVRCVEILKNRFDVEEVRALVAYLTQFVFWAEEPKRAKT